MASPWIMCGDIQMLSKTQWLLYVIAKHPNDPKTNVLCACVKDINITTYANLKQASIEHISKHKRQIIKLQATRYQFIIYVIFFLQLCIPDYICNGHSLSM
ncbi:hypothetical protein ACOSQ3_010237 [Xanthoceras sorbifolium]